MLINIKYRNRYEGFEEHVNWTALPRAWMHEYACLCASEEEQTVSRKDRA